MNIATKVLPLAGACIILAGCVATMPQQAARPTAADDPSNKCFQALGSDQRFAPLTPHLGDISKVDQASIEMLASTAKPTEQEKKALSVWGVARQTCADMGRSFRAEYAPPGWATAFDAQQNALIRTIASLYAGNITYGQFIAERQRLASSTRARLDEVNGQDRAARTQQAQQEAARADAALQMMLQQQRANQPVTTTCNRFMNTVNCTTR